MKRIILILLVAILSVMNVAKAATYIKEVAVSGSSDEKAAINYLANEGYTVLKTDLNKKAGGWYVFLGYKTTNKYEEAITNLMVMRGESYHSSYSEDKVVNVTDNDKKWEYHPVKRFNYNYDGDLNRKAGGEYLYLYYTRSNISDGQAISSLSIEDKGSSAKNSNYVKGYNEKGKLNSNMDFNEDAGGRYVYVLKGIDTYKASSTFFDNEFRVIHHGGNLYQFIVPLAYVQENVPTQYMAYGSNTATVACSNVSGGSTNACFTLNNLSALTSFSQESKVQINASNGKILSGKTFEPLTGSQYVDCDMGNHRDRKMVSVLWQAPDGWVDKDLTTFFELKGSALAMAGITVSSVSVDKWRTSDKNFTLATGTNNVTLVEPYMDFSANKPGWQSSFVSSVQKFYSLGIWDATENKFVIKEQHSEGLQNANFSMPSYDSEHEVVALLYSDYVTTLSDGKMDTVHALLSVSQTVKAVHSIVKVNDGTWDNQLDSAGIPHPAPVVEWAIESPRDEDLLSSDQFVITRSGNKDFLDASIVASFAIEDTTYSNTADSKNYGWYRYVDELDEKAYTSALKTNETMNLLSRKEQIAWKDLTENQSGTVKPGFEDWSKYCIPSRKLYYNISRAVLNGVWTEDTTAYSTTIEVPLTAALPTVSKVTVQKLPGWDVNHKVEVTVKLDNPYIKNMLIVSKLASKTVLETLTRRLFVWDASAGIEVERYSPASDHWMENGKVTDYAAKTFNIQGKDVKWNEQESCYYASFIDYQTSPYTSFYYKARVDTTEALLPTCIGMNNFVSNSDAEAYRIDGMAFLSASEASNGTYPGLVYVKWEVGDGMNDGFKLYRRPAGGDWKQLILEDAKTTNYKDSDVLPGTVYEYKIVANVKFKGKEYVDSVSVFGTPAYYGNISGKVRLADGAGMPAKLNVRVQRQPYTVDGQSTVSFNIPDMYYVGADGKQVLLKDGYSDTGYDKVVPVAADGTFYLDSIPYSATGIKYRIQIEGVQTTFENPSGVNGAYDVLMDKANYDVSEVNFTCNDVQRISGYVMFDGSTVPSRYVHFKVNGVPVTDANGKQIETDQKGAFSFNVPKMPVSIQAYRDGHEFKGEGFVLGGTKADQQVFTPLQDYDGVRIWDQTKVRLVGRLAGGSLQEKLPQGLGFGTNNLGDDLEMVLQLEGDESSQIVFNQNDPDNVQRDTLFFQSILHEGVSEIVDSTEVSFQKKRIVVRPNVKTGEFCLDLYPTKYKITQLSAKGYSTLFSEGEGFEVIDLTNDTLVTNVCDTIKSGRITDIRSGSYQAVYQKIYHTEPQLTYAQTDAIGNSMGYLGEKNVSDASLAGTEMNAPLAWQDKSTNQWKYLFGHPVFKQGSKYFFKVSAHEDYYYNGERNRQPDVVSLDKGSLTIYNGLESSTSTVSAELDANGTALVVLGVNNPTFVYTGEQALRNVNMQVAVNGYYYRSDTLKAYVLGMKREGKDFATMGESINVLDIVHDPYGTSSYAYREAGTKYYWSHNSNKTTTCSFNVNTNIGGGSTTYIGVGLATKNTWSMTFNGGLNIPMTSDVHSENGEYTMTLNERITTSSAAFDEGACADVYIGTVDCMTLGKSRAFAVIDSASYKYLKTAIDNHSVQLVREGMDKDGVPYYLVIGDKLTVSDSIKSSFAYSQKFILGTLIPNMEDELDQMVLDCSSDEADKLAKDTGEPKYYRDDDGRIRMAVPNANDVFVNNALELHNSINAWREQIALNERKKLDMINRGSVFKHYSVANTSINYTESESTYYTSRDAYKTFSDDDFSGTISGSIGGGGGTTNNDSTATANKGNDRNRDAQSAAVSVPGFIFNLSAGFNPSTTWNNSYSYYRTTSAGSGFVLSMTDNSYMDIDVYRYVDQQLLGTTQWDFITSADSHSNDYKNIVSEGDFIFVLKAGARRNPWLAPDSTIVYLDRSTGKGYPLGEQLLKIDNPKIYIDQPVVSNVPKSERAVFSLRLANETEISKDAKFLSPSVFKLKIDDGSNPNGVKIYMDGMPITDGRTIRIAPGTSVTKTFEVERGAGYDFENVKLKVTDNAASLIDNASFSVHFLPEASPVRLVQPTQNWVINTLSASDSIGYYLPVEISGFDINYENFDHIELQYKKTTEGESQWVNVCSFYDNDSLYEAATGNKAKIVSGSIRNVRFYGASDPVEVSYDLRAVSFCRLGTGFVSKSSEVMSGLKDTRKPQVFGLPKPTDGILSFDEVISLPFNENVAFNNLNAVANFQIQGYTNNSDIDHGVSMRFHDEDVATEGYKYPQATYAISSVERSLTGRDFSIDMMAKIENVHKSAILYMQEKTVDNIDGAIYFGYSPESDCLVAYMDNALFSSDTLSQIGLNVRETMTHIGMTYQKSDSSLHFFVGDKMLATHCIDGKVKPVCNASGKITLGYGLIGNMTDVRLWGKALSPYEIANKSGKRLSDEETGLIAYWPMDEGSGTLASDKSGGADLALRGCTWETPAGYSLKLEGTPAKLHKIEKFQRDAAADYSLAFWFRADKVASDSVALFRSGDAALDEIGNGKVWIGLKNKKLVWRSNAKEHAAEGNYADGQWHKLVFVVNHSQNVASMYVDQVLKSEFKASEVDGVANDQILLGDDSFYGNIDELSFWHLALPYSYLQSLYNTALLGTEMELQVYLPFEMDKQNDQATMFTDFSPYNMKKDASGKCNISEAMVEIASAKGDNALHAPIRPNTGIENFSFDWVCTDNELQIDIKKADKDINHQQVFVTVRGVEDNAGNTMEHPQMWSVYVDRNVLVWDENTIDVHATYGSDTTLVLHLRNNSGKNVNYSISKNCSWLTLSKTMGTVVPMGGENVEVDVLDALSPGKYSTTIYLIDENGLVSPLTLNLMIEAIQPDWAPTSDQDYNQSMLLVGEVYVKDSYGNESIDNDKRDLVGVFCNGVCVGTSHIVTQGTAGKGEDSNIYLNIRGTSKMNPSGRNPGQALEFRLWDATRGTISILVPDTIRFANNKAVGVAPDAPIQFHVSEYKVQEINLNKGWNWVSFNVEPLYDHGLNMLFMDNDAFSNDDVIQHVGNPNFGVFDENDKWVGGAESIGISFSNVYLMYMHRNGSIKVKGRSIEESRRVVHIANANRWNELPYLLEVAQPIDIALSDYPLPFQSIDSKATEGDWVKSHDEFAVATTTGWVGSLKTMRPGVGYYIFHKGAPCDIKYTNTVMAFSDAVQPSVRGLVKDDDEALDEAETQTANGSEYASGMPAILALADETAYQDGDIVVAYVNGKEVGHAERSVLSDGMKRFFLMVNAADGSGLQFGLVRNGEVTAITPTRIGYDAEGMLGSLGRPYLLDFSKSSSEGDVYDLLGRRYNNSSKLRDVYIRDGQKVLNKKK